MKKAKRLTMLGCLGLLILLVSACGRQLAGASQFPESTDDQVVETPPMPVLVAELDAPATLENGETVPLTFTLINYTDNDVYALNWHTPFEGIANEIFRVTRDGEPLLYQGPLVKRGDPSPDDYVLIQADDAISVDVDLATAYDFSQPGVYTIEYTASLFHLATSEDEMAKTTDDLEQIALPATNATITIASALSPSDVNLTGTVMDVAISARIINLEAAIEGFSHIALTEETTLTTIDGHAVTLREVQPGATLQATGQPGASGTLIATDIRLLDAPPDADASPSEMPTGTRDTVPTEWETYANADFGYQIRMPSQAEVEESGVLSVPGDAVPEGTTPEAYIAKLQSDYPDTICVQIHLDSAYLNILAPTDLGFVVTCGRTGVGAGELIDKTEQVTIGGKTYTAKGFEFISSAPDADERLAYHNETFVIELDDGTRIEYGSRPTSDVSYATYLAADRKLLMQMLTSYQAVPVTQ